MTYSIVARDPETGALGVGVQSRWFSVGRVVPWAEPGVGAVATQSFVEPAYGRRGLALMRDGLGAPDALRALASVDPGEPRRQVAMVDAAGRTAVHTGDGCVEACGHRLGDQVSAQANMVERPAVWEDMVDAYATAQGDLADRLLAALEAAEAAGGDARGRQSAALLVAAGTPTGSPLGDVLVDLRVDDHAEPLLELRRLLTVQRAYDALDRAIELAEAGDPEAAVAEAAVAAELLPEDDQIAFWRGVELASAGRLDEAGMALAPARAAGERWSSFLERLPRAGLLPDDPRLLDALRSALKDEAAR